MTGETSKQQRQAASAAYLKMRAEHRARVADMEVIIDPGDYANVAKGLLDGPKLKNGLTARISAWPNPAPTGASDEVRLYFDGGSGNWVEVGYHKFTSPFGDVFPFPMLIDVNSLPDSATCKLKYTVTSFNDEETDSQELTVICDRRPPYNHAPPPELTLVSSELDDTNLPSTGTLAVKVRGYADWQATDDIHIYLVDAANIPEDLTGIDPVFSGKVPAPGITDTDVHIPAAKIRAFGDAQGVLLYVLVDEAKNPSALSYHKKVTLTFGPLPSTLHPPKVPQAVPGPLVNEDAVKGVSIWLEIYQNWKLGDTVRVFWGDTQVGPEIPFRNVPTFEVLVLPPVLMLEEYGASTTGIKQTNVRYEVYRQGRKFGPASANFPVNFEVPIPWIPFPPTDWPNPIHPSLLAGTVKNFDDSRTNELERADKGKDASFTIKWYAAPENGDVVNFYWNGKLVVEAKVIFDDAAHTPGADLKVTIPWAYIREGGNGAAIPVHYQVHRPGVANDQNSVTTNVEVDAVAVDLPPASCPKITDPTGWPNCGTLEADGSLLVAIPDLTGLLADGDTVTVKYVPMKGNDLSAPDDPIDGVEFEKDFVLGSAEAPLTGFTFAITPYATYIEPLYTENADHTGRIRIHYSFHDGSEEIDSEVYVSRTAFLQAGGQCPITP